jgi:hypothetical protein
MTASNHHGRSFTIAAGWRLSAVGAPKVACSAARGAEFALNCELPAIGSAAR